MAVVELAVAEQEVARTEGVDTEVPAVQAG